MILTPTASSQGIAGGCFWATIWSLLLKLQKIAKVCRVDRWVNQDKVLLWINHNKVISFIISELVNECLHPPTNGDAVCFLVGGSIVNFFMIFVFLPLRFGAVQFLRWLAGLFIAPPAI